MFVRADIAKLKQDLSIDTHLLGHNLTLKTRWGLFSPKKIDDGSLLLLKYLQLDEQAVCLDLGCGYGVIGLAAAKCCAQVEMVDKDFIAVELCKINAKLNHINNVTVYLSDAFRDVKKTEHFDHIFSNIPAKIGREQLSIILYDAYDALKPGGKITFVTINGLRHFIKDNFKSVFTNYQKIKQSQKYTLAEAVKL